MCMLGCEKILPVALLNFFGRLLRLLPDHTRPITHSICRPHNAHGSNFSCEEGIPFPVWNRTLEINIQLLLQGIIGSVEAKGVAHQPGVTWKWSPGANNKALWLYIEHHASDPPLRMRWIMVRKHVGTSGIPRGGPWGPGPWVLPSGRDKLGVTKIK